MKIIILTFTLVCSVTYDIAAQKLKRDELTNTEWFVNNVDSTFEMFAINLGLNDSIVLFKRLYNNVRSDSVIFGKQEFATIGHHYYANFEFRPKASLLYYLTSEDNPFHTIVGQMPLWTWKLRGRNKIKLFQSGKYEMTLKLVIIEDLDVVMGDVIMESKKITLVRIK